MDINLRNGAFSGGEDLDELVEDRIEKLTTRLITKLYDDDPDEETFIDRAMDEIGLDIPEIQYDSLDKELTGSKGNEKLNFKLPVRGNTDLLKVDPSDEDIDEINVKIDDGILKWNMSISEETENEVEERLQEIQDGYEVLRPELEDANERIEESLRNDYRERMDKAEEKRKIVEEMDIDTPDSS